MVIYYSHKEASIKRKATSYESRPIKTFHAITQGKTLRRKSLSLSQQQRVVGNFFTTHLLEHGQQVDHLHAFAFLPGEVENDFSLIDRKSTSELQSLMPISYPVSCLKK